MRWVYHLMHRAEALRLLCEPRVVAASLATEGYVHASFAGAAHESRRLYFGADDDVVALQIAPHRLDVPLVLADTPRGKMPHLFGSVVRDAVVAMHSVDLTREVPFPDQVLGLSVGIVGFSGMTLLDLVGVWDPLSRIASMGFDPGFRSAVMTLDGAYVASGMQLHMATAESLASFDAVVIVGGPSAHMLAKEPRVQALIATLPRNRTCASVCTGALFLGEAQRLRGHAATTHASALHQLAAYGATAVRRRVVDEGSLVTAAGVTAAIDLGLHLVERWYGAAVRKEIGARMEVTDPGP
jgi:putative intracellular protease/amidase